MDTADVFRLITNASSVNSIPSGLYSQNAMSITPSSAGAKNARMIAVPPSICPMLLYPVIAVTIIIAAIKPGMISDARVSVVVL